MAFQYRGRRRYCRTYAIRILRSVMAIIKSLKRILVMMLKVSRKLTVLELELLPSVRSVPKEHWTQPGVVIIKLGQDIASWYKHDLRLKTMRHVSFALWRAKCSNLRSLLCWDAISHALHNDQDQFIAKSAAIEILMHFYKKMILTCLTTWCTNLSL
jgi:hypothetical protein